MNRGDIYYIDLPKSIGSIQSGIRPVIILQNNIGNTYSTTTIVACITSKKKKRIPTHCFIPRVGGLKRNSIVLCEQIFTVEKQNLKQYVGTITNNRTLNRLNKCIQLSLGLGEL